MYTIAWIFNGKELCKKFKEYDKAMNFYNILENDGKNPSLHKD
jgi:hypothetical protein